MKLRKRTPKERIKYLYSRITSEGIRDMEVAHMEFDNATADLLEELGEGEVADKFRELIKDELWYS